jgi:hypothetical protein
VIQSAPGILPGSDFRKRVIIPSLNVLTWQDAGDTQVNNLCKKTAENF